MGGPSAGDDGVRLPHCPLVPTIADFPPETPILADDGGRYHTPLTRGRSLDFSAIIGYNEINADKTEISMASLTIRNLDPAIKERLRVRAAEHGHSMEAEARQILQTSLREPERPARRNLYERIRARFAPLGGADDLELPPRQPTRDPPRFD
jgi:plasmid stability protein